MASRVHNSFMPKPHCCKQNVAWYGSGGISRDISEKDIILKLVGFSATIFETGSVNAGNLLILLLWLMPLSPTCKYALEVVVHTLTVCPCINVLYWCCIRKRTHFKALHE